MRFAIAALLGLVSAASKEAMLKDEMTSLLEIVKAVQTQDQSQIFNAIEVRKDALKGIKEQMPERSDAIRDEVISLKSIVTSVLEEDYENAVDELEMRKDGLIKEAELINLKLKLAIKKHSDDEDDPDATVIPDGPVVKTEVHDKKA